MRLVLTHFAHRPTGDDTFHLPSGDETGAGGSWYGIKVVNAAKMYTTCDLCSCCTKEAEEGACLVWSRVSNAVTAAGAPDNATMGR